MPQFKHGNPGNVPYGGVNPMGDPRNEAALAEALQRFGMALPERRQNVILPNTGFFGEHNRLSSGIENALLTLSLMGEPSPTIGGNISNVAQALVGAPRLKTQLQIGPQQEAVSMAGQVSGLRKAANEEAMWPAQKALIEAQTGLATSAAAENRAQTAAAQADKFDASEMISDTGHPYKYNITKGHLQYIGPPELAPKEPPTFNKYKKEKDLAGKTLPERLAIMEEDADTIAGKPAWDLRKRASRIMAIQSAIQLNPMFGRLGAGVDTPDAAAKHLQTQLDLLKQGLSEMDQYEKQDLYGLAPEGWDTEKIKDRKSIIKRALGGFVNQFYKIFQTKGELMTAEDYIKQLEGAPRITAPSPQSPMPSAPSGPQEYDFIPGKGLVPRKPR